MCIIAVKPASKAMFNDSVIKQMFSRNRDGAGLMWTENETVHFKKGFMTVHEILNFVHSRNWDGVPVVLHFRIGTAGPNNGLNCHPYPIWQSNRLEGECDLCMAHNGILSSYTPEFGSKINDTQVFVNKVLSNLPEGFLESKGIRHLIRKAIGTNRLCFLSKTGKITRFGNWVEDDGYFFSNESYKVPKMYSSSSSCAASPVRTSQTKTLSKRQNLPRSTKELELLMKKIVKSSTVLDCHSIQNSSHILFVMERFVKFADLQISQPIQMR